LAVTSIVAGLVLATSDDEQTAAADPTPTNQVLGPSTQPGDVVTSSAAIPSTSSSAVTKAATTAANAGGGAPTRFATLPPGTTLPTGAQCASWVRAQPYPENKRVNATANRTTGHHIGPSFFSGDDPRANSVVGPRVDGQFTGTTGQILRWAACKWGVDQDLVFAQAAIESWWRQSTLGDWSTVENNCAPGRGFGVDGQPGKCPESFGILQNRYPYERTAWPGIANSTAMNADLAYAIFRVCYEGWELWLNDVQPTAGYRAGDAWGCVGRWFSGRWHTPESETYVGRVRDYLNQRIWTTPNFQE
jgi:autotransporter family porin